MKVICDKNETTLAGFKKQYPQVKVCLAFSEVLSREDIEGVVIATPAETHFLLTRELHMYDANMYLAGDSL